MLEFGDRTVQQQRILAFSNRNEGRFSLTRSKSDEEECRYESNKTPAIFELIDLGKQNRGTES
jgi:hypothetical protein